MTSIDQFVLVPYERYERLLKGKATSPVSTSEQDKKEEESNEKGKQPIQTQDNHFSEEKKEALKNPVSTSNQNSNSFQPPPHLSKNTIPHRPPGIPNKSRKKNFRWYTLH